jgi:hypothetical protein
LTIKLPHLSSPFLLRLDRLGPTLLPRSVCTGRNHRDIPQPQQLFSTPLELHEDIVFFSL